MSTDRAGLAWSPTVLLLTCEHAGNEVPEAYASLFEGVDDVLRSHRGYDPGVLDVAQSLANQFGAPFISNSVTRLLIDLNRSLRAADLFSEFTRDQSETERAKIISDFYEPYHELVGRTINDEIAQGARVLHLGMHSFVDEFEGDMREIDVALLFDPAHGHEREFCAEWGGRIRQAAPELRFRLNEPYHGAADGLTTSLRREFPGGAYAGVEIELRQGMLTDSSGRAAASNLLAQTLTSMAPDLYPK